MEAGCRLQNNERDGMDRAQNDERDELKTGYRIMKGINWRQGTE